jgi:hypothetical protein
MKSLRIFLLSLLCQACFAQHWQPMGNGLKNFGATTQMFTDTINDKLYVAGPFTKVDDNIVPGIAGWDGNGWDSLGHGIDNYTSGPFPPGNTWGIDRLGSYLYIGGNFSWTGYAQSEYLSRWDGTAWSTIPGGQPNHSVVDVVAYNNELYICGVFDSVGNVSANGIARWDGAAWHAIGSNYNFSANGSVLKMQFYHGNLYVGGMFQDPLGNTCRLAKWDGITWQFMTNDLNGDVWDLEIFNDELYLSGSFYQTSGNVGNCIMRWNDTTWSDVGGGVDVYMSSNPVIKDMCIHNGKLYCTGYFAQVGGITAMALASWDGTNWCGYNTSFQINTQECGGINIAFYHDTLYVSGGFTLVEGDTMYAIAEWIGGNFVDQCGNTTGINESISFDGSILLFPNPANQVVIIECKEMLIDVGVIIIDQLGREVRRERINNNRQFEISTVDLTEGMYFYQLIEKGEKKAHGKFIVQH